MQSTAQPATEADREQRKRAALGRLRDDFEYYAPRCLKIRGKDEGIIPLRLNAAQRYAHAQAEDQKRRIGMVRKLVLKGRQQGLSTYIAARFYHKTSWQKGKRAFTLTHDGEATKNLFAMTKRYHDHCPADVKPQTGQSSVHELTFKRLETSFGTGTAGNESVGVAQTIQYFHGSEVALWDNAQQIMRGVLQAVPLLAGTEIWLESTSRGLGNLFHAECMKALKGHGLFELIFIPWFWQDEYRLAVEANFKRHGDEEALVDQFGLDDEQLAWRRAKIAEMGPETYKQEYPNTVEEAFEVSGPRVLVSSKLLRAAVGREVRQVPGPMIWGVDCSLGGDASTLAKRRTNVLVEPVKELLKGQSSYDTFAVARAVFNEFRETPPSKRPQTICVDSIGIGAGVAAQMRQDGLPVMDVNVSERPSAKARFMRLRDELWWSVREWYEDMGVSTPDDEALIVELAGIPVDDTAAGRVKIESKKEMIKRLGHSPDRGEAFMLTFAASDLPEDKRGAEPPASEAEVG